MDANGGVSTPTVRTRSRPNPLAGECDRGGREGSAAMPMLPRGCPAAITADNRALALRPRTPSRAAGCCRSDRDQVRHRARRALAPQLHAISAARRTGRTGGSRMRDELDTLHGEVRRKPVQRPGAPRVSGVAMYREPRGGFVRAKPKASCGDVGDGSAVRLDDEEYEKLDPGTRIVGIPRRVHRARSMPDVTDPTWDDFAEAWARMVDEHGSPTVEPAAEAVIPELSRDGARHLRTGAGGRSGSAARRRWTRSPIRRSRPSSRRRPASPAILASRIARARCLCRLVSRPRRSWRRGGGLRIRRRLGLV